MKKIILFFIFLLSHNYVMANKALPKVMLYGNLGEEYTVAKMKIYDNEEIICDTNIKFKIRGGTSILYDKKSMAIKLIDEDGNSVDMSFFGMRNDNNWILDAMAIDKSRMRNRVSFDLWNEMSVPSYIKKEYEEESLNGIRGVFVEVYMNDNFHGLYCLNEKIDRKQLKLKKYKEDIRGLLYKADTYNGTLYWNYDKDYDNEKETWMGWECKYPELDEGQEIDWKPLIDNIDFVLNASKTTFIEEVEKRFDLPVIIDYIIFYKTICAQDNYGKNQYAYFYNIKKDKRQGMAPWDLDATFGRGYNGDELPYNETIDDNGFYSRLNKDYPDFKDILKNRYAELRKGIFNYEYISGIFARYFSILRESGVLEKECEKWDGKIRGMYLDFDDEEKYIDSWIYKRFEFMDEYYEYFDSGIKETYFKKENNNIYNLNGQKIKELERGIYIKNGKKYAR